MGKDTSWMIAVRYEFIVAHAFTCRAHTRVHSCNPDERCGLTKA